MRVFLVNKKKQLFFGLFYLSGPHASQRLISDSSYLIKVCFPFFKLLDDFSSFYKRQRVAIQPCITGP